MSFVLRPWHLLLIGLSGWINRQQQAAIEFQRTEVQVLRELLGKKRLLLNDDQRRRLAVKGQVFGRKLLDEVATIVTPDTILRWHRQLVAAKWDYSRCRKNPPGRPAVSEEVTKLVLQLARENPTWGYDRIQGAVANLGHVVSDSTVGNILRAHGIEPAPERKRHTTWKTFLKAHWETLSAIDFTTIEVWTRGGLVTFYLLFVMQIASRRVHFAGCTTNPDATWMKQVARNLTNCEDGFLNQSRYLLLDRDAKFTEEFQRILKQSGVEPLLLPPRSPNLNAHLERFMRSIKDECLSRMIFFDENALRNAARQFLAHYHAERNHQGLENRLIDPGSEEVGRDVGATIHCRERLGGLLRYYYRDAA